MIRNLIYSSFDEAAFVTFCNENFPSAAKQFTDQMGFLWKIQWLLHYCREQQQLDDLLQQLQQRQPHTYEQFQASIFRPPASPAITNTNSRTIRLELNSGSAHYQLPLQRAFLAALAQALHIAPQQITNLQLEENSNWLQLDLPIPAASQLLSWYTNEDPILRGLGMQRVELYLPLEQRQAITEISQQAITQLAPEEADLAKPFIDPLINMTLLNQYATIRSETTFGGFGSNFRHFLFAVPIIVLTYLQLQTKREQALSRHEQEERLNEIIDKISYQIIESVRTDIEASVTHAYLEQMKPSIQAAFLDLAEANQLQGQTITTQIGYVKGSVHTGSGDIVITQAEHDNVQALVNKDQVEQTTGLNKVALLALILVVVILALLLLALGIIA